MEYKKNNRPVYLNLFRIRQPIGGIVSIVHRITGVILVLLLPLAVYLLQQAISGEVGFRAVAEGLSTWPARLVLLALSWLFAQHFFSGIRHLLQDMDIGLTRCSARRSAWLSFVASAAVVLVTLVGWL